MKSRTGWDVELRVKLDMLADLNYATCGCIVPETLEMENENGWKRLNEDLAGRIRVARAGWAVLHGLRLGDAHEGVLTCEYCEYRIRLRTVWRLVITGGISMRAAQREKRRHGPGRRDGVIASLL
jgi:hypothetical protein